MYYSFSVFVNQYQIQHVVVDLAQRLSSVESQLLSQQQQQQHLLQTPQPKAHQLTATSSGLKGNPVTTSNSRRIESSTDSYGVANGVHDDKRTRY